MDSRLFLVSMRTHFDCIPSAFRPSWSELTRAHRGHPPKQHLSTHPLEEHKKISNKVCNTISSSPVPSGWIASTPSVWSMSPSLFVRFSDSGVWLEFLSVPFDHGVRILNHMTKTITAVDTYPPFPSPPRWGDFLWPRLNSPWKQVHRYGRTDRADISLAGGCYFIWDPGNPTYFPPFNFLFWDVFFVIRCFLSSNRGCISIRYTYL